MAPKRGESIEPTEEHTSFLAKLAEYHEKRGTTFDAEPKVGVRHIDLLKLYKRVVEEGGYDLCSDTKAKPLMWRKLAEEFVGKNQYTAAQAFQVKNVYYKTLCAYEISTHWGKEPPPKEILEDVTAKGGNVMTRTLENFARPTAREPDTLNGEGSDGSTGQRTPEKNDVMDDPGSASGRTSRGLRQQPPQRVLFQPDLNPARQTRGTLHAMHGSPVPGSGSNGIMNPNMMSNGAASATLASYEPSQSYPLSLKPVVTPANNPGYYREERKRKAELSAGPLAKKYRNIMLPGTGFVGPNIYVRAQLALQSGLPEEEQYALHHLVKISHERGDKYRFDQFPGLAEALVKKALQVSSLFYDVEWDINYDEDTENGDEETLDGLSGTSDVIQRLLSRMPLVTNDSIQDANFHSELVRITEAGLVIRNMCLQTENAHYLSRQPLMRDYLAIVLNLPRHPAVTELQYYALETAEQLVVWCDLSPHDALYQSLLAQLRCEDRGVIVVTLKTIARIAMNIPTPKRLDGISPDILQKIQDLLVVEDEELRGACLDFLFQYTTFSANVENLINNIDAERLARQLSRLLLFAAKAHKEQRAPTQPDVDNAPAAIPRLSRDLVESLLKVEEPERSSEWLRMCFAADSASEMTQISLWQAYQQTFAPFQQTHPHLIAGDFIKNVSTTYPGATAQVAAANKYVIRGIKARKAPVDTGTLADSKFSDKGKELHSCQWTTTVQVERLRDPITGLETGSSQREAACGEWFKHGDDMLKHILRDHLQIPEKVTEIEEKSEDFAGDEMDIDSKRSRPTSAMANGHTNGTPKPKSIGGFFDFTTADKTSHCCRWASCTRTSASCGDSHPTDTKSSRTALLARHIQTHLPDTSAHAATYHQNIKSKSKLAEPFAGERLILTTLADEKGDAAGIPLSAALVLRNIAKFIPRGDSKTKTEKRQDQDEDEVAAIRRILLGQPPEKEEEHDEADNSEKSKKAEKPNNELLARIFDSETKERIFHALAHGKTIKHHIGNVLLACQQSEA
ncbi:Hypothetical protein R9X50_00109800 [Acrodontium crateriforme]|uniref:ARID domain-containing protein n=1 Tax=Acrodontium crateriforme TaxID=150365 RepID=A0AAQ3R2K5_9PEZI|nr:Hypothetical protein R9X50_00109800 [Acrodontium crateriforme]